MSKNSAPFGIAATLVGAAITTGAVKGVKADTSGWGAIFGPTYRSADGRFMSKDEAMFTAAVDLGSQAVAHISDAASWVYNSMPSIGSLFGSSAAK